MFFSDKPPYGYALSIKPFVTFNSPLFLPSMDYRHFEYTQMGGDFISCKFPEHITRVYNLAKRFWNYHQTNEGNYQISVKGIIKNEEINQEFTTFSDFELFLEAHQLLMASEKTFALND